MTKERHIMKLPEFFFEEFVEKLKKGEVFFFGFGTFRLTTVVRSHPTLKKGKKYSFKKKKMHYIRFLPDKMLKELIHT